MLQPQHIIATDSVLSDKTGYYKLTADHALYIVHFLSALYLYLCPYSHFRFIKPSTLPLLCWFQTSLPLAALLLWWWYFCIQLYVKRSSSEQQSGERQASMIQTLVWHFVWVSLKLDSYSITLDVHKAKRWNMLQYKIYTQCCRSARINCKEDRLQTTIESCVMSMVPGLEKCQWANWQAPRLKIFEEIFLFWIKKNTEMIGNPALWSHGNFLSYSLLFFFFFWLWIIYLDLWIISIRHFKINRSSQHFPQVILVVLKSVFSFFVLFCVCLFCGFLVLFCCFVLFCILIFYSLLIWLSNKCHACFSSMFMKQVYTIIYSFIFDLGLNHVRKCLICTGNSLTRCNN